MSRLEMTSEKFGAALVDLVDAARRHDDAEVERIVAGVAFAYTQLAALVELDVNKLTAPNN
jgi:hypothetical protein